MARNADSEGNANATVSIHPGLHVGNVTRAPYRSATIPRPGVSCPSSCSTGRRLSTVGALPPGSSGWRPRSGSAKRAALTAITPSVLDLRRWARSGGGLGVVGEVKGHVGAASGAVADVEAAVVAPGWRRRWR